MNHEKEFELTYEDKEFLVNFDTEGPHENMLMSVWMDSYPIDDITLRSSHKILFAMIETRMRVEAEKFWNGERKKVFAKLPNMVTLAKHLLNI